MNPQLLIWARERSGYSVSEAARAIGRSASELTEWEEGASVPSYAQLEKLAYKVYKRPVAVFFFPEPPVEEDPRHAFRTLPDFEIEALLPDTRLLIRRAKSFQISLGELTGGVNPAERLIFRDIRLSPDESAGRASRKVRDYLGISVNRQASWATNEDALKGWRGAIQEVGVFVFKDAFKQKEVSGFCLLDREFPLIYVNNSTAFSRQTFTLFHELAHLLLNTNGVTLSDISYIDDLHGRDRKIEIFCNRFAGELLVPHEEFDAFVRGQKFSDELVEAAAEQFRVSREVVLRRFLDRGLVSDALYDKKAREWAEDYKRNYRGKGGSYYTNQVAYLGQKYLRLAFGAHRRGECSTDQLAMHLNVGVKSLPGLEGRIT